MAALHLRTIEGLALAIEAKDQNTHDHLCRVRVYAAGIASELKLSQDEREALMAAALLHDIGKLAVPEYIINKPGRLTPEEFDKIKIHPIVGAEILKRVSFPYPVDPIVRSHHEQWDGCGYPDGLKGEQIPVGARILAVVDCFDALASDRPYRRALTLPDALAHVQRLSGIQFDPEVVGILAAHYQELEVRAREESRKMEPLRTDIVVPRGHAPSAGFEKSGPVREVHGEYLPVSTTRTRMESEMVRIFTETLTADITEDTLPCAIATLGVLIPFDIVIIYVREGAMLRPSYMDGDYEEALLSVQLAVGQGLCGWVAQSRQDILNGNPSVEVETWANPAMARMHSTLAHPLVNKEDSVVGVIAFYHAQPDFFTHAHLQALQLVQASLTSFLACALENPPGSLPQTLNRLRKPAADLANVG
jgi:putative nucleotidyltransferase with HDIG domain